MSRPRILGHMVTRNEADRYLPMTLAWLNTLVDGIAVFDDQSTDGTVAVGQDVGALVRRRPETVPGLLDDEARFREAGWRWMELALDPQPGDWVACVDADEALTADIVHVDAVMRRCVDDAVRAGLNSLIVPVAEVFGFSEGRVPLVRSDGYWSATAACRLVAWQPGGTFSHPGGKANAGRLGCGSVPSYADGLGRAEGVTLLHYGYATAEDRQTKYERYNGRRGHAASHVQSILGPPQLRAWTGTLPEPLKAACGR